jgi:hypothetical protein
MRAPRPPSMTQLEAQRDQFNRDYPVGTDGWLRRDNGTLVRTIVEEPAYVMSGHTVVAFFKDVRGCYAADRFSRTQGGE